MKTDLAYLKNMSGNNSALITEMIGIFTEQIREISEDMQQTLDRMEWESLSRVAHKAKTSVAIMGMSDLANSMKELEINAHKGTNQELYPELVSKFMMECAEAIEELQNYINEHQNNL